MIFDNTAIVAVRRKDHRINFRFMSKNEAVHEMTAMKMKKLFILVMENNRTDYN